MSNTIELSVFNRKNGCHFYVNSCVVIKVYCNNELREYSGRINCIFSDGLQLDCGEKYKSLMINIEFEDIEYIDFLR